MKIKTLRKMLNKIIFAELGLECIPEYKFHDKRRWRFDYAIVGSRITSSKIAVEIEGGIWSGGRHTRGKGFIGDMEKYNTATAMGWKVIRIQPNDYTSALEFIKMILDNE